MQSRMIEKTQSGTSHCHAPNFLLKLIFILLQSTHRSSVQLSATKFHFHSLLSQKRDDEKERLAPQTDFSIPVLNVLKCCQSAHISAARQANRINPGLTLQVRVKGKGLG